MFVSRSKSCDVYLCMTDSGCLDHFSSRTVVNVHPFHEFVTLIWMAEVSCQEIELDNKDLHALEGFF